MAYRLLRNVKVQEAITSRIKDREKRTEITQDMVLRELAKIGFANMGDYMKSGADGDPFLDFSQLTRDQSAALAEVTVEDFKDGRGEDARDVRRIKFKLADKKRCACRYWPASGHVPEQDRVDRLRRVAEHANEKGQISPALM